MDNSEELWNKESIDEQIIRIINQDPDKGDLLMLAFKSLDTDNGNTAIKCRQVLEKILRYISWISTEKDRSQRMVGQLLALKEIKDVPENIRNEMIYVKTMGNKGSHGEKVNGNEARLSLSKAIYFTNWFLDEYPNKLLPNNSTGKYTIDITQKVKKHLGKLIEHIETILFTFGPYNNENTEISTPYTITYLRHGDPGGHVSQNGMVIDVVNLWNLGFEDPILELALNNITEEDWKRYRDPESDLFNEYAAEPRLIEGIFEPEWLEEKDFEEYLKSPEYKALLMEQVSAIYELRDWSEPRPLKGILPSIEEVADMWIEVFCDTKWGVITLANETYLIDSMYDAKINQLLSEELEMKIPLYSHIDLGELWPPEIASE